MKLFEAYDTIESNTEMIFIVDKFPKGSSHYLCLPNKKIDTWWHLKKEDIPLLQNMQIEAKLFSQRREPDAEFAFGFHVIPSMK